MSAPSHEFVKSLITPGEPLPSHSTMKKTFPEKPNVPLSPLLIPPFHISREKKTLTSTPLPLNNKKKKKKNQDAPFQVPPSHNEYNIDPGPSQQ
jgi:hypothetical protein